MKTKEKINRHVYKETLKAAAKYYKNRNDFERAEELDEELKEYIRIEKKKKRGYEDAES